MGANDFLLSKNFSVIIGGEVVAFATDFSLEINKETIDVTVLRDDGWKQFLVDLKDWSVSFSGLITRGDEINSNLWNNATAYIAGNFVVLGGKAYEAQGATTGDNPSTDDGSNWLEILEWSSISTYAAGDLVYKTVVNELRVYKSLVGSNLNNDPVSSPTQWERLEVGYEALVNYIIHNDLPIKVMFLPETGGTTYFYGDAHLTNVSGSGATGDKAPFAAKAMGTELIDTTLTP